MIKGLEILQYKGKLKNLGLFSLEKAQGGTSSQFSRT